MWDDVETIRENYADWCAEGAWTAKGHADAKAEGYVAFDAMIAAVRAEAIEEYKRLML